VQVADKTRNLKGHGLEEGASTRMLVYAATLVARGIAPVQACRMAVVQPLTDDAPMQAALSDLVLTFFD
jgi:nitric oxide reductase NorQ protein